MPNITVILPDHFIPWVERKRQALGLRSRHATILRAIEEWCAVPLPVEAKESDSWPMTDSICPSCEDCAAGIHCGGRVILNKDGSEMIVADKHTKTRERWFCGCTHCTGIIHPPPPPPKDPDADWIPDYSKIPFEERTSSIEAFERQTGKIVPGHLRFDGKPGPSQMYRVPVKGAENNTVPSVPRDSE